MVGCLGFIFLVFIIWIWYLIYRYIGHSTIIENCWMCEFPEHYTRNWFGDLWIYSFIWIPILVILILWLKKNLRVVKEKILLHKIKVVISSIVTVVIIIFFILLILNLFIVFYTIYTLFSVFLFQTKQGSKLTFKKF